MNGPSLSYTDLNAMAQMKAGSQADSPENMERVARQFESLFLNVMLKSMRDANQVFAEGNPLNSPQTRFYQDMYDNQMAVHLAEKQGMGLADVMLRQLQPSQARPAPAVGAVASGSDAGERADQSALLARRRLAIRLVMARLPWVAAVQPRLRQRLPATWLRRPVPSPRPAGSPCAVCAPPSAARRRKPLRRPASTVRRSSPRPCCRWRRRPPRDWAWTRITWWPRPRWKPVGASPSFAMAMAAPATTCSASRAMASGRATPPAS